MKKAASLEIFAYVAIFFLPLYLVRLDIGFLRTNLWEAVVFFAVIFWVSYLYPERRLKIFLSGYGRYAIGAAVMLGGLFLSAFFHGQKAASLGIIKSWFLLPIIFVLMVADTVPLDQRKRLFWAYGLSAFFVAIISLGYLVFFRLTYDGRLEAFFNSPNYLAMYLVPGLLVFLHAFWSQTEKIFSQKGRSAFLFLGIVIMGAALYRTYSYGAWIAFLAAAGGMFFLKKKRDYKFFSIAAVVILSLVLLQLRTSKFEKLATGNPRSSWASRQMIWNSAWKMIEQNPISGIGPANFQKVYLEYQKFFPPYLEWAVPHPQNLYLDFWLSGGILGLGGFVLLTVFFLSDIWKKIKSQKGLAVLAFGIMAYILVHGLVDATYFKNDLSVVFWLNFLALGKKEED